MTVSPVNSCLDDENAQMVGKTALSETAGFTRRTGFDFVLVVWLMR